MDDNGERSGKQKLTMTAGDLGDYLRELAAAFDKGRVELGEVCLSAEGLMSVKAKAKVKPDKSSLAIEIKWRRPLAISAEATGGAAERGGEVEGGLAAETDVCGEAEKRPSYKKLKKRIEGLFKRIRKELDVGVLPGADLVVAFERDAELMLLFPKKGDRPSLEAFWRLAREFGEVVRGGDLDAARCKAAELRRSEKTCHDRFK